MKSVVFLLAFLYSVSGNNLSSKEFSTYLNGQRGKKIILDCRSEFEREVQGFIEDSFWFPGCGSLTDSKSEFGGKKFNTILCIFGRGSDKENAKSFIKSLDLSSNEFHDFDKDLREVEKFGVKLAKTRFIHYEALSQSLRDDAILFIDVRNRTELNEVGQIPGSVCLPLHEIPLALTSLDSESFASRYGFAKPTPEGSDKIVLTCRSGKRVLVADSRLKQLGFDDLRIYSGSYKDWVKNGGETFKAALDLDYEILA